jgi:hypothetical protein
MEQEAQQQKNIVLVCSNGLYHARQQDMCRASRHFAAIAPEASLVEQEELMMSTFSTSTVETFFNMMSVPSSDREVIDEEAREVFRLAQHIDASDEWIAAAMGYLRTLEDDLIAVSHFPAMLPHMVVAATATRGLQMARSGLESRWSSLAEAVILKLVFDRTSDVIIREYRYVADAVVLLDAMVSACSAVCKHFGLRDRCHKYALCLTSPRMSQLFVFLVAALDEYTNCHTEGLKEDLVDSECWPDYTSSFDLARLRFRPAWLRYISPRSNFIVACIVTGRRELAIEFLRAWQARNDPCQLSMSAKRHMLDAEWWDLVAAAAGGASEHSFLSFVKYEVLTSSSPRFIAAAMVNVPAVRGALMARDASLMHQLLTLDPEKITDCDPDIQAQMAETLLADQSTTATMERIMDEILLMSEPVIHLSILGQELLTALVKMVSLSKLGAWFHRCCCLESVTADVPVQRILCKALHHQCTVSLPK